MNSLRATSLSRNATCCLFLAIVSLMAAALLAQQQAPPPKLQDLAWITGAWVLESEKSRTEEHWTDIAGNMMLGVGRTIVGGKTVFFEFLRIGERADGIYYVAQPRGRAATDFKLTRFDGKQAIFENPQHDFPKRVLYRRNDDGSITARIDGGEGVTQGAEDFHYQRLRKP